MRAVSIVVFCLMLASVAALTNKEKFDSKVCALGVELFNPKEIAKGTECMEDPIYAEKTMDELRDPAIQCAYETCPASKYGTVMKLKQEFDDCVDPADTFDVLDKVWPAAKKAVKKVYNKLMKALKKQKKNGKSKEFIINKGYANLVSCVTRPLINTVCKKLKPLLTDKEWKCVKTTGKKAVDFSQYDCFDD